MPVPVLFPGVPGGVELLVVLLLMVLLLAVPVAIVVALLGGAYLLGKNSDDEPETREGQNGPP